MGITRKEASRIGISFTAIGLTILILLIIVHIKMDCWSVVYWNCQPLSSYGDCWNDTSCRHRGMIRWLVWKHPNAQLFVVQFDSLVPVWHYYSEFNQYPQQNLIIYNNWKEIELEPMPFVICELIEIIPIPLLLVDSRETSTDTPSKVIFTRLIWIHKRQK